MARKSRTASPVAPAPAAKVYNTAIYARLSVEDNHKKESDSIDNQIYLIRQYVEERPYLKLCSVFSDNGETGVNFQRPGFTAMMDEVRAGKINCIVVKDLSRFGRNYIETGEYLEKIFPFMGIRFVSINDGLDNEDADSNTDALIVSLKNLINDVYAKDISQKIISSLRTKQMNGDYIGGRPLYGYRKSAEDCRRLAIDPETAPVVRDIFRWKVEGMSDTLIARRLNGMGIPSPMKRKAGEKEAGRTGRRLYIWRDRIIRLITTNPMYIGHMTQGRTKQALYENMPLKVMPQSEWIIVKNTHEPIVTEAVFERAQEVRADNTAAFYKNYDKRRHISGECHLFKGLLICADCGSRLIRMKSGDGYSFRCSVRYVGTGCTPKSVDEAYLYGGVLQSIKSQVKAAVELSAVVERLNRQAGGKPGQDIEKRISAMQKELKRVTNLKAALYDSYVDRLLTEGEYICSKQRYGSQIDEIRQQIELLQAESVAHSETLTPKNKYLQAFKRFTDYDELSREMVCTLIDHIVVSGSNELHIAWNFKDEYGALCAYTGEVMA